MISPSYSASTCAGHVISLNFLNNSREYYYSSFTLEDARTTELKNLPHRWPACKISPAWLDSLIQIPKDKEVPRGARADPGIPHLSPHVSFYLCNPFFEGSLLKLLFLIQNIFPNICGVEEGKKSHISTDCILAFFFIAIKLFTRVI